MKLESVASGSGSGVAGGLRIRMINQSTRYYFGDVSKFGDGASAPEASKYDKIGQTLSRMKAALNPDGNGKGKNTGKYLGKDLAWWRQNSQDVLHPLVLAFAKSN